MKTNKEYIVKDTFVSREGCPECGNKVLSIAQFIKYDTNKVVEHVVCTDCQYIQEPGIVVGGIQEKDIRVVKAKADAFDAIMGDEALTNYFENWYLKSSDRYKTIKKGIDAFNRGRVDV